MVFWPSSKSPHTCHGTKETWESGFNNNGTERKLNLEALFCLHRMESTKEHIFHFLLTILTRNHSYHVTHPCSLVPLHNTIGVLRIFLSQRVRTLWILFLYTFASRLKTYALPNLAVCLHQRVELNWLELNDSRIGLSFVLIINKIYIIMITYIVIANSITWWLFLLRYMERSCHH